jgi:hypothetical protein
MACLRIAEHCANLLLATLEEAHEAGDRVEEEMKQPLQKLIEYFAVDSHPSLADTCPWQNLHASA